MLTISSGMRCASALYEAHGLAYPEERLEGADLPLPFLRKDWVHLIARIVGVLLLVGLAWWLAVRGR